MSRDEHIYKAQLVRIERVERCEERSGRRARHRVRAFAFAAVLRLARGVGQRDELL